jgi:hypothetical protein
MKPFCSFKQVSSEQKLALIFQVKPVIKTKMSRDNRMIKCLLRKKVFVLPFNMQFVEPFHYRTVAQDDPDYKQ